MAKSKTKSSPVKPLTGYSKLISEFCGGVDAKEALLIESIMRVRSSCLDGLDRQSFKELAKLAKDALDSDPELREMYASDPR